MRCFFFGAAFLIEATGAGSGKRLIVSCNLSRISPQLFFAAVQVFSVIFTSSFDGLALLWPMRYAAGRSPIVAMDASSNALAPPVGGACFVFAIFFNFFFMQPRKQKYDFHVPLIDCSARAPKLNYLPRLNARHLGFDADARMCKNLA